MTARSFASATTDYLSVTSTPVNAVPLTIMAWFTQTTLAAVSDLVNVAQVLTSNANSFRLGLSDAVEARSRNATVTVTAASNDLMAAANTWYNAIGVFESSTARRAALNGVLGADNTTSNTPASSPAQIAIGRSTTGNLHNGLIAHVAIWNATLTADEVLMLGAYRISPMAIRPGNLVLYMPYIGRDSPEIDIVGGRTLTVNGSPATSNEAAPQLWTPGERVIILPSAGGGGGTVYTKTLEDTIVVPDEIMAYRFRVRQLDDFAVTDDGVVKIKRLVRVLTDSADATDSTIALYLPFLNQVTVPQVSLGANEGPRIAADYTITLGADRSITLGSNKDG